MRVGIALAALACSASSALGHGKSVSYSSDHARAETTHTSSCGCRLDATMTGLDPGTTRTPRAPWAAERLVIAVHGVHPRAGRHTTATS
jgi:hypothetical protein